MKLAARRSESRRLSSKEHFRLYLNHGGIIDWSYLLETAGVDVTGRIKHMLKSTAAHDFKLPVEIHLILVIGFLKSK